MLWLGIAMLAVVFLGVSAAHIRYMGWKEFGRLALYLGGAILLSIWITVGLVLVIKNA